MTSVSPGKTIFVVDDEIIIASTLVAILTQNGYRAKPFNRAKDALREATLHPPDLIISDVVMPGMSGIDLAIRVSDLRLPTGILLFSGQAVTADLLEHARRDGHTFEILSKPIHPTDLIRVVAARLGSPS